MAEALLSVRALEKRFGGVLATDGVSLDLAPGELHALIGPNGAGKTTLLAQLAGSLTPDAGSIVFEGRDIAALAQHRRVAAGIARSYQITSLFARLSVHDNLALAVQARSGSSFVFWRPRSTEAALFEEARSIASEIGLAGRENLRADALSHGEQRALEVGLALATRPRLLLLDEPMAGLGPEETARMIGLIERIRGGITVLLIEHDMDAVFRLAAQISVLVNGRVLASGSPEAIRGNPSVRRAYLGEELAARTTSDQP
jgi:branched-chain amino acid transport system ATP-binding protein